MGKKEEKEGCFFNRFRVLQALVSARWQSLFIMTSHNSHFSYCALSPYSVSLSDNVVAPANANPRTLKATHISATSPNYGVGKLAG
jgi:hypothetical protein